MAASIEKLLLEIKADIKELKNLRAELKQVRDEAAKAGKGISEGLSSALGGLASGLSALKIKSIMDNAVGEFNKLEKTMLGLQATARLTGNSFESLKSQVTKLASDGVLSIDQASTAMKTLLAQGIQADKAFSLLDAAKKVGAFNNIVGDTGQAVADFVKFLQTGSAELAENLDPSIIKVVKSLGGYQKVASDASAKQKLINAVIEKGGQLTQDYEKFLNSGAQAQVSFNSASQTLSQTLGQKLQPAYNALYAAGTKVLNSIAAAVGYFDSATVSIVAFGAAGFAALAGLAKAAAVLPGTIGSIGSAIVGSLGPIALVIAAVSAAALAVKKYQDAFGDTKGQELLRERQALIDIQNKQDLSIRQKERLKALNDEIAKSYDPILRNLGLENRSLEEQLEIYRAIDKARSKASGSAEDKAKTIADLKERIATREMLLKSEASRTDFTGFTGSMLLERTLRIDRMTKELDKDRAALAALEGAIDAKKPDLMKPIASGKPTTEFRFIELRDQIRELNKEYDKYLARLAAEKGFFIKNKEGKITNFKSAIERAKQTLEGEEATLKLKLETEDALSQARQKVAEFLEKEYDARLEKIEQEKNAAIKAAYEVYNQRIELAKKEPSPEKKAEAENKAQSKLQQDLAESNAMAFSQRVKAGIDSFNRTLGAANEIGKGLTSATKGKSDVERASGIGTVLEGAGKVTPGKVGIILQGAGQALKIGAELYSTFKGLFGKTDEEIKQAAEEQARRDEEARKLLELQASYQKRMLEIQEANAKTPFINLQRRLRLIDIQAQKERVAGASEAEVEQRRLAARKAVIGDVLSAQSATMSQGRLFNDVTTDAEGLTQFLVQRTEQAPYLSAFSDYVQRALGDVGSIEELQKLRGYLDSFRGKVPDELWNAGVSAVDKKIKNFWMIYNFLDSDWARGRATHEKRSAAINEALRANYATGVEVLVARDFWGIDKDAGRVEVRRRAENVGKDFFELSSEIATKTTVAEDLLSVVEQQLQTELEIKDATKKTAENTAKLTQIDDRRRSFLDLGNRRIFSQGLNIDFQNVKLPEAAAATILATSPLPALQSDTVTELKKVVSGIEEANEWLAIIAANTDQRAGTDTSSIDNYLIRKLAEIRARRIS